MKRRIILIGLASFLISITLFSQGNGNFSIYLIGDAGEDTIAGKALLMLKKELIANSNSAVVFLGDNAYPNGLKKNDKYSAKHLQSELSILNEYRGKVYFVPGNHDWEAQGENGRKRIKNEELYVNEYVKSKTIVANKNDVAFLPSDGLPGPTSVMLNDKTKLILIDTQWFLHRYKKNVIKNKKNTEKLFYAELENQLKDAKNKNEQVIIAAHHPMFTNGEHSRNKQPLRFFINRTPLCIFGLTGLYDLYSQDLAQPKYKKMRKKMLNLFNQYDNIIYASGHDHNLQCFTDKGNKYIVSGCGSKLSPLMKRRKFDSLFQEDTKTGFLKIIYDASGNHSTVIYRVGEEPLILKDF